MDAPILRFDHYSQPHPHILPVGPRVAFEITKGRVKQRLRPVVGRAFLIGTASDCDLVLGDLSFPEAYAYVLVQGSEVSVRRLGAGPELLVSGEATDAADLFHGDRLAFGPFELRLVVEGASPAKQASRTAANESVEGDEVDQVSLLLADIRRGLQDDEMPSGRDGWSGFSFTS
jgi:hypothetical protein